MVEKIYIEKILESFNTLGNLLEKNVDRIEIYYSKGKELKEFEKLIINEYGWEMLSGGRISFFRYSKK